MKNCDEVITVFNQRANPDNRDLVWVPTVIKGVSWYDTQVETVSAAGGLLTADKIVVRIPADADTQGKVYAPWLAYAAAEDVSGLFTLKKAVIVRGEAQGDQWTPETLKAAFDDCMIVKTVADNRRAPNAPHFRVVGD